MMELKLHCVPLQTFYCAVAEIVIFESRMKVDQ